MAKSQQRKFTNSRLLNERDERVIKFTRRMDIVGKLIDLVKTSISVSPWLGFLGLVAYLVSTGTLFPVSLAVVVKQLTVFEAGWTVIAFIVLLFVLAVCVLLIVRLRRQNDVKNSMNGELRHRLHDGDPASPSSGLSNTGRPAKRRSK